MDPLLLPPQMMIWKGDKPYWRSGPWSGIIFIGTEHSINGDPTKTRWTLLNDNDKLTMEFNYPNKSLLSNYVLGSQGFMTQRMWDDGKKNWQILWQAPENECSVYGKCGEFGYGNCYLNKKLPICQCLTGFASFFEPYWFTCRSLLSL